MATHCTPQAYTILDTSESSAFVHVNHGEPTQLFGNVYVAGPDGSRYALSLRKNTRDAHGNADFARVRHARPPVQSSSESLHYSQPVDGCAIFGNALLPLHKAT